MIAVEAINDRKIGLEKFDAAPFFGNEQQAFSLKKEAVVAGAPQSYRQGLKFLYFLTKIFGHFLWARIFDLIWSQTAAETAAAQAKKKHMSDKELKAKIEVLPTRW